VWAAGSVDLAEEAGKPFDDARYQLTFTDDIVGVELCSMVKNVAAIGVGILDGIGKAASIDYQNAKAALFTKAAHEIVELVTAGGGRAETAMGLAGIGDQLVTSLGGRNRLYGELVGAGGPPEDMLTELQGRGLTVEGVDSTRDVRRLATELDLELPYHEAIHRVLFEDADPSEILEVLDSVAMDGVVVIGEGEKDEAPMLYNGEAVGNGTGPPVDVAVDPIDGTRLTATGQPNAVSVIALAERGTLFFPGVAVYMEKVATGAEAADAIDVTAPPEENVRLVAKAKGIRPEEVTVMVLDRPRHEAIIRTVRDVGARVYLITDGDVAGAISAATPRAGVDLLIGIGGTPEGVVAAAALKCMGGAIQGRLSPRDDQERDALVAAGLDPERVLFTDDLVSGKDVFFAATGITDGSLLRGVRYWPDGATTYSLVMRSRSGTLRWVEAEHRFEKLEGISGVDYRR
jgi:fructose-1,6-bisphosphatase II